LYEGKIMGASFNIWRNGPPGGHSPVKYKVSTKCSWCLSWTDVSDLAPKDPGICKQCGKSLNDFKHGYTIDNDHARKLGLKMTSQVWCNGTWIKIPAKKWWQSRPEGTCYNCKRPV
jgi:hypothetical protein